MNGDSQQGVEITAVSDGRIYSCQTDPDFLTNREDIQTLPLRHQFIQQAQENDYATVETNMDSVIDTVIQAFLNDASLGGTADGRISRQAPRPSFLGR